MPSAPDALRRLRTGVLRACRAAGVLSIVRDSGWRQHRVLIIGYHGVALEDEHEWQPHLYMSAASFEARLEMIRRGGYAVLPLDEALTRLQRGSLPKRSVVLTFDDGYYNFYRQVYPALR